MTFLSDPFDRFLFLGAFAAVTVITSWAVIGFVYEQRRRKIIMERPTQKTMPTLPTVIPAAFLDASDSTPTTDAPVYCLACWLGDTIPAGRPWYVPDGTPAFCAYHAYGTLARALSAQRQQQETGEKYL